MKIESCSFRSIIKASGIYDIIIMLPFAVPGISEVIMKLISQAHYALALNGSMPEFSPFHLLFVNIMASVSIVWAVIRARNPIALYAWYDTTIRILIAATMLVYLLSYGITEIIWLFFVAEISWAALQINGYFNKNNKDTLACA
jgi:hypothetical protein